MGNASAVGGLAHVLFVDVVGREVARDAGEEVDVGLRDRLAEGDAAPDGERLEAVLARGHGVLLSLARAAGLTLVPGARGVKPAERAS